MSFDAALRTSLDRFTAFLTSLYGVAVPWGYAVGAGEVAGASRLHIEGFDAQADATGLLVWPPSNAYTWQTADQQPRLVSNSGNDDGAPAGTGAQIVRVTWLNAAGVEATEDVVMNGVGVVVMAAATARRINRMEVVAAGASTWNEGTITCYATDGVTRMSAMSPNKGVTDTAIQTVPAGKVDYIERLDAFGATGNDWWSVAYRESPTAPWKRFGPRFVNVSAQTIVFDVPLRFAAGTDYYVWGRSAAGNAQVLVTLSGWRENA